MKALLCLLLALGTPVEAAIVETADGDWSQLPYLVQRGVDNLDQGVILGIQAIAIKENCRLPGQEGPNLDSRLSFAAQFSPDGTLNRIILPRIDCPKVEGALGGALIDMIKGGDYRPTGQSPEGWYQGRLTFSYQS